LQQAARGELFVERPRVRGGDQDDVLDLGLEEPSDRALVTSADRKGLPSPIEYSGAADHDLGLRIPAHESRRQPSELETAELPLRSVDRSRENDAEQVDAIDRGPTTFRLRSFEAAIDDPSAAGDPTPISVQRSNRTPRISVDSPIRHQRNSQRSKCAGPNLPESSTSSKIRPRITPAGSGPRERRGFGRFGGANAPASPVVTTVAASPPRAARRMALPASARRSCHHGRGRPFRRRR
jgi:hypothetical protein